jgi:transketolase
LRATPNIYLVRPADFNETALAWQFAVGAENHPTALALTRQGVPTLDHDDVPEDAIERGAYVLREAASGSPDVILIGTGSEVHICLEAAELLEAEGIAARVVSMPCMDRFAEQDESYQDSILPRTCGARVAVEAASGFGWHEWVGPNGELVTMRSFGKSAPAEALFEHFGFTPENVAEQAKRSISNAG